MENCTDRQYLVLKHNYMLQWIFFVIIQRTIYTRSVSMMRSAYIYSYLCRGPLQSCRLDDGDVWRQRHHFLCRLLFAASRRDNELLVGVSVVLIRRFHLPVEVLHQFVFHETLRLQIDVLNRQRVYHVVKMFALRPLRLVGVWRGDVAIVAARYRADNKGPTDHILVPARNSQKRRRRWYTCCGPFDLVHGVLGSLIVRALHTKRF